MGRIGGYPVFIPETVRGDIIKARILKAGKPECVIQDSDSRRVTEIILNYLKEKNIPPYDAVTKSGTVRHIYTRISAYTKEILAVIVATEKIPLRGLKERLENTNTVGVVLNINKSTTNKILGDTSYKVFGQDHITDRLCGTDFDIYPDSFFQVNQFLTERIYNKAVKLANLTGKETVFDLYCGAGTLTAALSKHAGRVFGIEVVPSAVKLAR